MKRAIKKTEKLIEYELRKAGFKGKNLIHAVRDALSVSKVLSVEEPKVSVGVVAAKVLSKLFRKRT